MWWMTSLVPYGQVFIQAIVLSYWKELPFVTNKQTPHPSGKIPDEDG
jgi:hypothetical protein